MKFALIDGERQDAQPGLSGQCPACGKAMIARCGEINTWHWAHKGRRTCDPWWESETEWHRSWKEQFPESWQEVVHHSDNGEKHIADVTTGQGWVLEFQHSHIKPEERLSRDNFYKKLIWVVDGTRRKRDSAQFLNAWKAAIPTGSNSPVRKAFSDECALLREWVGSPSPVFFDFGGEQVLWWLLRGRRDELAYVAPFSRNDFIAIHRGEAAQKARNFDEFVNDLVKLISQYESNLRAQALTQSARRPTQGVRQYLARRGKPRRRL